MTLATTLLIGEPVNPNELMEFQLDLLGPNGDGDRGATNGRPSWKGEACIGTNLGQGLPALTDVTYAQDAPLTHLDPDDYGPEDEVDVPRLNVHLVAVRWDTAYGYKTPSGAGCADLHAYLLAETMAWLADRGVTDVEWYQEFTGEWFSDTDVTPLGDPVNGALTHPRPVVAR